MRILIVYAMAGVGHSKAARALFNYLKENYREHQVSIIDALIYSNPVFRFFYTGGYFFLSKNLPSVWKFLYQLTYAKEWYFITRKARRLVNFLNTRAFADFLIKENPDIVISTHMLAGEVISDLKKQNRINPRLINVVTDFGVHPFWIDTGVDEYIVALDYTKDELIDRGIDKVKVLGIPVDLSFTKEYNRERLCDNLSIRKNEFTVLIVTGTIGIGPIEKICARIYKDAQILVVCGRNERLYKRLKQKNYPGLKVFGLVDNIAEPMAVSDIILTKAGGLTVSESLSMGLPMIFFTEIPGQETKNAKVLGEYGVARTINRVSKIRDSILEYKNNPQGLREIREKIDKIKRPFATRDICDEVCKGSVRFAN